MVRFGAFRMMRLAYTIVFKGTELTSAEDWENNCQQFVGYYSAHEVAGVKFVADFVKRKAGYQITLVGHSKGGGEAAINAELFNKEAIIFNPSVPDFTWGLRDVNHLLGEIPLGKTEYLPQQHNGWLPGVSIVDRMNNHMMNAVIAALVEKGYTR